MNPARFVTMIALAFFLSLAIGAYADQAKVEKSGNDVGVASIHVDKDGAGESDVEINDGSGDPVKTVMVRIPGKVGGNDVPQPTCVGCSVQKDSQGFWRLTWNVGSSTNTPINKTFKTSNLTIGTPVDVEVTYKDDSMSFSNGMKYQRFKTEQSGKKVIDTTAKKTVMFSAATGLLTMENDVVSKTGFAGDPLLGANVMVPQYRLVGPTANPNFVEFALAGDDMWLQIDSGGNTFLRANAPFLYYNIATNQFYAGMDLLELSGAAPGTPFYSPGVSTIDSPGLDALAAQLNPNGDSFLGTYPLGTVFAPDDNFYADTGGYTADGESGFVDYFVTGTPEPSSLLLLGSGVAGLWSLRRRVRVRT